jgi:hypothetical protein
MAEPTKGEKMRAELLRLQNAGIVHYLHVNESSLIGALVQDYTDPYWCSVLLYENNLHQTPSDRKSDSMVLATLNEWKFPYEHISRIVTQQPQQRLIDLLPEDKKKRLFGQGDAGDNRALYDQQLDNSIGKGNKRFIGEELQTAQAGT